MAHIFFLNRMASNCLFSIVGCPATRFSLVLLFIHIIFVFCYPIDAVAVCGHMEIEFGNESRGEGMALKIFVCEREMKNQSIEHLFMSIIIIIIMRVIIYPSSCMKIDSLEKGKIYIQWRTF